MKRAVPVVLALMFGVSAPSHAHRPGTGDREQDVGEPKISFAFYGELEDEDDLYVLHLDFDEGFALPFEILVPRRAKWEDHRPVFAIVGPGLPAPTQAELDLLPREVPAGAGVFFEPNDDAERELIFETFTRRVFWTSGPIAVALGEGEHEVWVFSPDGSTGDFVLGFGVEEDFSGVGCGDLTSDWATYAY